MIEMEKKLGGSLSERLAAAAGPCSECGRSDRHDVRCSKQVGLPEWKRRSFQQAHGRLVAQKEVR
jgi:hypothetical protein